MWRAKLSFDMGRDKKTSKGRLDKFYKLAKEQVGGVVFVLCG